MPTNMLKPSGESGPWYRMEADAAGTSAVVYIYDVIDSYWGVNASDFVRDLESLDVETINLRVNSPGGSVFDGVAIMNALRRHPANVVATVDGLAASAASFIIQAADEVIMGPGTELMIHEASNICWGNAGDMLEMAGNLDRISGTIAGIYAERAGGTVDEWRAAMKAETWYTADEAVAASLADRALTNDKGKKDKTEEDAESRFDLSVFAHAGRSNAPAPAVTNTTHDRRTGLRLSNGAALPTAVHLASKATPTPPAEPKETTNPQGKGTDTMSEALKKGIRDRLGITNETLADGDYLAALDEALAEQTEQTAPQPAAAAPGTVIVDADQFAELQASAADGREARKQQLADARATLVKNAVKDGRIAPARRDHWLKALAADPGMAETLASLEPGLVVPLEPVGRTGGVTESTDEDLSYNNIFPKES